MMNYFQKTGNAGAKMDIEEQNVEPVGAKPWIEK